MGGSKSVDASDAVGVDDDDDVNSVSKKVEELALTGSRLYNITSPMILCSLLPFSLPIYVRA